MIDNLYSYNIERNHCKNFYFSSLSFKLVIIFLHRNLPATNKQMNIEKHKKRPLADQYENLRVHNPGVVIIQWKFLHTLTIYNLQAMKTN